MRWVYNDGGRELAGFRGYTGDCVVRAIAIATGKSYKSVYDDLHDVIQWQREDLTVIRSRRRGNSPRNGVPHSASKWYIEEYLGWRWVPIMLGSECAVHLGELELPLGNLIVHKAQHLLAVIDGVVNDLWDSSVNLKGQQCFYGYWVRPGDIGI